MLLAATVGAQIGAADAGIVRISPAWLVVYGGLVLLFLRFRGHVLLASARFGAGRRAQGRCGDRARLDGRARPSGSSSPGDVDDLASQSLRLLAFSAVYVAAGRVALDWAQLKARRHGDLAKPTLIVGAGRIGRLAAQRLLEHPEFGLQPVGFLDKEPLDEPGPARCPCSERAGISSG